MLSDSCRVQRIRIPFLDFARFVILSLLLLNGAISRTEKEGFLHEKDGGGGTRRNF